MIFTEATLAQHIAVLGKTGSGKTSTAKLIVEQVAKAGARVCVLDPIKSDWWGLTSSADGKRPGLAFQILGGPRGHVPLHETSGNAIGELVASSALPLSILDMAEFRPGRQSGFFTAFAAALMRRMRGVIYLVVEEAHLFAPKERSGMQDENASIHYAKLLAAAGRSKGIRLILVTQRTQALHNALLGSCDSMIAHRMTAPADQEPVIKWLKANTTKARAQEIGGTLSSLKTGTGWLCSSESGLFESRHFPRIATYDNTRTPTGEDDREAVKTAPVDLEALRALVGEAVKEAEANDPKKLRARVEELERDLSDARAHGKETAESLPCERCNALESHIGHLEDALRRVTEQRHLAQGAIAQMKRIVSRYDQDNEEGAGCEIDAREEEIIASNGRSALAVPSIGSGSPGITEQRSIRVSKPPQAKEIAGRPDSDPPKAETLTGAQQRILDALAWFESIRVMAPDRRQVGMLARIKPTGGHFGKTISPLSAGGFIFYPSEGLVSLTESGKKLVKIPDGRLTLRDYHERILSLSFKVGKTRSMLRVMIEKDGAIAADELGRRVEISREGGHFGKAIEPLVTLGLIVRRGGMVSPTDLLFPESLRA